MTTYRDENGTVRDRLTDRPLRTIVTRTYARQHPRAAARVQIARVEQILDANARTEETLCPAPTSAALAAMEAILCQQK